MKLPPQEKRIAQHLKRRLQEITPVNRFVVFGSRAKGTASPDSDLDIYIELPDLDASLRGDIREIAWEISLDEGILITTFVVTTRAISDSPLGANPILRNIAAEGIAI